MERERNLHSAAFCQVSAGLLSSLKHAHTCFATDMQLQNVRDATHGEKMRDVKWKTVAFSMCR